MKQQSQLVDVGADGARACRAAVRHEARTLTKLSAAYRILVGNCVIGDGLFSDEVADVADDFLRLVPHIPCVEIVGVTGSYLRSLKAE